jgi:hypothetical protein
MNLYNIIYNFIRITSILSILVTLIIGLIFPISLMQGLVINPIIVVSLMVFFSISHKKLRPTKKSVDIVRLPDNSKLTIGSERKVA